MTIRPSLSLGSIDQPAPDTTSIRETEPLEERIEIGSVKYASAAAKIDQTLALKVATRTLAGDGGDALRAVLGKIERSPGWNFRSLSAPKRPTMIRTRSR